MIDCRRCHSLNVYTVARQLRGADGGEPVVIIPGHCHILRDTVSLTLEPLNKVESNFITVADERFRHLIGQAKWNESPLFVAVLKAPIRSRFNAVAQKRFAVAKIAVHNGACRIDAARKADFFSARRQKMFGHRVAAGHIVAEDAVRR